MKTENSLEIMKEINSAYREGEISEEESNAELKFLETGEYETEPETDDEETKIKSAIISFILIALLLFSIIYFTEKEEKPQLRTIGFYTNEGEYKEIVLHPIEDIDQFPEIKKFARGQNG